MLCKADPVVAACSNWPQYNFDMFFSFQECKHMAFFYDNGQQCDDEIIRFINQGLEGGQLCIYGTVHFRNKEYFRTLSSKIKNYEQNVKDGHLVVVDFVPFYDAALKGDLTPYKEVQSKLCELFVRNDDLKVRYVGDATGLLFKDGHFDECVMIESWWQQNRIEAVTTLCLFQKSLMDESPFADEKERVIRSHDAILGFTEGAPISSDEEARPIPVRMLKEALNGLEGLFGRAVIELLIEDLGRHGFNLSSGTESYSLKEIHHTLSVIFGKNGAKLVVESLQRGLRNRI